METQRYWSSLYWSTAYWGEGYWATENPAGGTYWPTGFWATGFWTTGYWAYGVTEYGPYDRNAVIAGTLADVTGTLTARAADTLQVELFDAGGAYWTSRYWASGYWSTEFWANSRSTFIDIGVAWYISATDPAAVAITITGRPYDLTVTGRPYALVVEALNG